MSDHLAKPIDPELLFATLTKWLGGKAPAASARTGRGTDPDADRLGLMAPHEGDWVFFNGNEVGSTAIPEDWYRTRFGTESIALLGSLLILVSLTMTGGAASPYLLLSMGPPIFATIYGGLRPGLMTASLSAGLLALVTLARGMPMIDAAPALRLESK